jgi:CHAT domain-containing protein
VAARNGLLTAEEVLGMDLHSTELVVLSACETGMGKVDPGEGVLGLRWAFAVSGARTLVMSLWKVPDLATAVLMDRFYHNLLDQGLARDRSLREAQKFLRGCTVGQLRQDGWLGSESAQHLAGRSDSDRPFEDPCYWGAFICQGDPSPLLGPSGQPSSLQSETREEKTP